MTWDLSDYGSDKDRTPVSYGPRGPIWAVTEAVPTPHQENHRLLF